MHDRHFNGILPSFSLHSNESLVFIIFFYVFVESGAVFTLGKSYLSENHQSYFFIRNDPIRKLIAGRSQSAVICGNFGLFVNNIWYEFAFVM